MKVTWPQWVITLALLNLVLVSTAETVGMSVLQGLVLGLTGGLAHFWYFGRHIKS